MQTVFFASKSSRVRPWPIATDGDALSAHPPLRPVSFPAVRAPDQAAAFVADLRANLSRHRSFVGTDVTAIGDPASAINALDSKIVARSAACGQCAANNANDDQTHSSRSLATEARQ